MKFNLEFYKQDIKYNNMSQENLDDILELVRRSDSINYEESLQDVDFSSYQYNFLSNLRKNIICWYDFKNKDSVLQIGMEYGIITDYLCDIFKRVVAVDFSKNKAQEVAKKLSSRENLEIFVGSLSDIKFNEKFDYITLIGSFDKYKYIFKDNLTEFLDYLKSLLKDDGKILIALDNKFAVKYFSGSLDDNVDIAYSSLQNTNNSSRNNLLSKKMLEELFNKVNIKKYNFYYPLPDYRLTSAIFSDKYLPNIDKSKLVYNINNFEGSHILFDERKLLVQLLKNGDFDKFTNSYFIEVIPNDTLKQDNTIFVSYNINRNENFKTITKIKLENNEKKVYKYPKENLALEHIKNIGENIINLKKLGFTLLDDIKENHIESKYSDKKEFHSIIIEQIKNKNEEKLYDYIKRYYEYIIEKLGTNSDIIDIKNNNILKTLNVELNSNEIELFESMNITKNGYIDLVFENVFVDDSNNLLFFDQEWYFYNTPTEFILYRCINNMYMYTMDLSKYMEVEKLYSLFGIDKYINIFKKIEKSFQSYVQGVSKDRFLIKPFTRTVNINQMIINQNSSNEYIKTLEEKSRDLYYEKEILKQNLEKEIESKNNLIKELNDKLNYVYNSKSWKFIQSVKKTFNRK